MAGVIDEIAVVVCHFNISAFHSFGADHFKKIAGRHFPVNYFFFRYFRQKLFSCGRRPNIFYYYIFEKENYRIIGKNTRKSYSLGEKIRVRVKGVDIERKSIDYELINDSSKK